jgi:hypothetical protein
MEITTNEYNIKYDEQTATICWQGIMRLNHKEYEPIGELLEHVASLDLPRITLNLQQLTALNSSGVTLLGKFIFDLNRKKTVEVVMLGDDQIAWQKKSVKNFRRLMPKIQFEWK